MKKLLLLPLVAVAMFLGATPASSTQPVEGEHKVTICHNVLNNPHAISIDVAATGATESTHGLLTLNGGVFVSFVPSVNGAHTADFFLHLGDEVEGDDEKCVPAPPTVRVCINGKVETISASVAAELGLTVLGEGEACPVTTTTTAPPVIVEVPVEKIVEVPVPGPTMVIERTITAPAPATPTAPVAGPVPAPAQELPRTGSGSILTLLGAGLTSGGLVLRRLFK